MEPEGIAEFESRKGDHIRLALDPFSQAVGGTKLDRISLIHEALPELDFSEVELAVPLFSKAAAVPYFISSMTAGHAGSLSFNLMMAKAAERRGWPMGVGSQRRQLFDDGAQQEWDEIRQSCPDVILFGNIGLAQLIATPVADIRRLAESLGAEAMIVHTNPLQECLQREGTPAFSGGLDAIRRLVGELELPVILKETGCGFSQPTLRSLMGIGLAAVDVSGFGGTHWGRVEGGRSPEGALQAMAAQTFANWGMSTVDSVLTAVELNPDFQIWASGGVRSGLDGAKFLAMGAKMVGLAMPIMAAAAIGQEALDRCLERLEFELKIALFCTGCRSVREIQERGVWEWVKT